MKFVPKWITKLLVGGGITVISDNRIDKDFPLDLETLATAAKKATRDAIVNSDVKPCCVLGLGYGNNHRSMVIDPDGGDVMSFVTHLILSTKPRTVVLVGPFAALGLPGEDKITILAADFEKSWAEDTFWMTRGDGSRNLAQWRLGTTEAINAAKSLHAVMGRAR